MSPPCGDSWRLTHNVAVDFQSIKRIIGYPTCAFLKDRLARFWWDEEIRKGYIRCNYTRGGLRWINICHQACEDPRGVIEAMAERMAGSVV